MKSGNGSYIQSNVSTSEHSISSDSTLMRPVLFLVSFYMQKLHPANSKAYPPPKLCGS